MIDQCPLYTANYNIIGGGNRNPVGWSVLQTEPWARYMFLILKG